MQLLRLAVVVITTLAVAGSYFQEMRRLSVIRRMPGAEARAYYEATRRRDERLLGAVTAVLAVMALGAGTWAFFLAGR